ncbi:MAG: DUF1080 domain-containing protein [Isosphaeraceae bacterium]|nr:DUF1080 domain-containing protein [Isosphaeraceae bacterium]
MTQWHGRLFTVLAVLAAASTLRAEEVERDFRPLFDGKSLAGWAVFGGKASAWGVDDGRLVSYGEGGGWLGTTRDYGDFDLRFDFRLTPESNSGVYLRAPADTSHISRTGMEIQLLDETHPRYKTIQPWQRTGAIYHVAAPEPGHLRPTGEWNAMEIRAEGAHVVIRLNGKTIVDDRIDRHPELAAEHSGLKRKEGRIGLQSHNGRVEFRNLLIRPLAAAG